MTEQDRSAFAELMFILGDTYNESISDVRAEAYFDALRDMPLETVRVGIRQVVRAAVFFPKPVEIRNAAVGSVDDRSELAWNAVLKQVRSVGYYGMPVWPDEPTRRAALELFGGWKALCERLPADGPELLGFAKQFKATFRSYANRDLREALPVASVSGYLGNGD